MDPMADEPTTPEAAAPAVEHCYRHPKVETRVHCTRCGRPICPDCMIPAAVGYQCPECVREARRAYRVSPARRAKAFAATSPTALMLGVIFVVFIVEIARSGGRINLTAQGLVDMGALVPAFVAEGQYWRLLSAMFLHATLIHILLNAYALYLFGPFVEEHFGRRWFLPIYLVSGFLASVASYTFRGLEDVGAVGVGASGAIAGLLGAFIAYNFRRRHLSLAQGNLRTALMIILLNAVFGFVVPAVDNAAHLGGLVAGIAAGAVVEGFGPRSARTATRWAGLAALVALGVVLAVWRTQEIRAAFGLG
jgi:membrane associated rhomboid family serine protease